MTALWYGLLILALYCATSLGGSCANAQVLGMAESFTSRPKALGIDGAYITTAFEISRNRYHNFTLLPPDYQFNTSVGVYLPLMRSGYDFSLGASTELKLGRSMMLERLYVLRVPFYISAKFGAANQRDCFRNLGLSVGAGLELYYSLAQPIYAKERALYPTVYIEMAFRMGKRATYIRYQTYLASHFMSKSSFQVGFYLPI